MLSTLPSEICELLTPVSSWVLYADPPQHPRLRTLLAKAFNPWRIAGLQSTIVHTADTLLRRFRAKGGGDAVTELAEPLHTISALLGISEADQASVKAWSDDVVLIAEPKLTEAQEHRVAFAWKAWLGTSKARSRSVGRGRAATSSRRWCRSRPRATA
ncbi:hypothetical protein [Kitasatospora griseola]|uniref:hypothetical protein n=1 Tax=Kitasatospora griseola TaxID=2064 RepID=UPI0034134FED